MRVCTGGFDLSRAGFPSEVNWRLKCKAGKEEAFPGQGSPAGWRWSSLLECVLHVCTVCASCVQDPEEREKSVVVRQSADSYGGLGEGTALYKLGLDKGAKPWVKLTTGVARTE